MFNARDLLGRLTESGLAKSIEQRVNHALGPSGLGGTGNPLGDVFAQVRDSVGKGGGLSDIAGRAEGLFGKAKGAVQSGNPLAIGGLAALAGAVLGGGGSAVRGAVGGGVLALLGSLAYSALSKDKAQAGEPAEAPLGLREPETAEEERALEHNASLIIRAMINAAKADGEIDATERSRIVGKLDETGASDEERAYVEAEMQKPLDTDGLAKAVGERADLAVQVYAASLLAIDVDTKAEEDYLHALASALHLDAGTVRQVHDALGVKVGSTVA
jgi:uncharacterized membrane protein YebE (DUF533 family)